MFQIQGHRDPNTLLHNDNISDFTSCSKSKDTEIPIQSTLVISKSKGPSETVRDIRTSTYQICSIEEKNNLNNQLLQMTM